MLLSSVVLEKLERDCPFCNIDHEIHLIEEISLVQYKGETIELKEKSFYCPVDDNGWVNGELLSDRLRSLRQTYCELLNKKEMNNE